MLKIFDTHAHLLSGKYDEDRAEFIQALPAHGVVAVVECATKEDNIYRAVELANSSPLVFAALGVYPHEAEGYSEGLEEEIFRLYTENDKVVAIGEIGLDYYYEGCPHERQKEVLKRQLSLAQRLNAPVSLHCREAVGDMMRILRQYNVKGVMHCYSGSVETARELIDMGYYFGIGGSLTFKNSVKAPKVAEMLPEDRILLETDCPYLAPVPKRGERNSPAYIEYVAKRLAEIKGTTAEHICEVTCANAYQFFNIEEVG